MGQVKGLFISRAMPYYFRFYGPFYLLFRCVTFIFPWWARADAKVSSPLLTIPWPDTRLGDQKKSRSCFTRTSRRLGVWLGLNRSSLSNRVWLQRHCDAEEREKLKRISAVETFHDLWSQSSWPCRRCLSGSPCLAVSRCRALAP